MKHSYERWRERWTSRTATIFTTIILSAAALDPSYSQTYPTGPVRVIVGTPAGGVSDIVARLVAEEMRLKFNQPFIVENKAGASGKIAAEYVARSEPTGNIILFTNPSTFSLPVLLDKAPPYDPVTDFAPIGYVGISANFLVVPASSPYKNLGDLLNSDKAKSGRLNFGNSSTGSASHFAAAMLVSAAGLSVTHVPYRGEAPVIADVISGQVDVAFVTGARPYVESGQLRALGVTSRERFPTMPDVPTISEQGIADFAFLGWLGAIAPAKTPQDVILKINEVVQLTAANERIKKVLMDNGISPIPPAPPERLANIIRQDVMKQRALVADGKIKVD